MIIHFYKKQFSTQFILFIFVALLLWSDAFIFPIPRPAFSFQTPLYALLETWFQQLHLSVQAIIAFFILMFQAFILNESLIRHKIITRNTFLPAILYVVLMSYSPQVQTLHPLLFSNMFLILSLDLILGLYLKPDPYRAIFNASFFIALASLFYVPSLIFLFLFWISLVVYRISAIREWIISISGLVAPYLFVLFYYFWTDSLGVFFRSHLGIATHVTALEVSPDKPLIKEVFMALGGLLIILMLVGMVKMASETSEKVITVRKRMNVIIYWLLIACISFIWADHNVWIHNTLMAIPLCMVISYFYTGIRRLALAEITFTLVILLVAAIKLMYRVEA